MTAGSLVTITPLVGARAQVGKGVFLFNRALLAKADVEVPSVVLEPQEINGASPPPCTEVGG